MNIQPNVLIFSTFNHAYSDHLNGINHRQVVAALQMKGIPFVELVTKREDDLFVSEILVVGFEHTALVESYAKTFGQDSYLRSHGDRFTEIVNMETAEVLPVGYLKAVSSEEAPPYGTYSLNQQTNTRYTIEARP